METIMISTILVNICIGCFACVGLATAISMIQSIISFKKGSDKYKKRYAFSGKIICGESGDTFKRRIHICNTCKYVAWACNTHLNDKSTCHMKYVRDDDIKAAFVTMLNKLIYGHRLILAPYLKALENSSSDEALQRIQHLELLLNQNNEQCETLTELMAQGYIDQILYNQETNALLLQAEAYRSDIEAITICMTGDSAKVTETNLLLHFVSYADDGISGTNTKNVKNLIT